VCSWQKRIGHLQGGSRARISSTLSFLQASYSTKSRTSGENVLVIFSDMLHDTAEINMETPDQFDARASLRRTEANRLIARLENVEVDVLGVDNASRRTVYWDRLRGYWFEYFAKAGAHVESYSVLRELRDASQLPDECDIFIMARLQM
jgi:hypothetical protein